MLQLIANDTPLGPERRDHALKGVWANYRECHIGGDFLLIYRIDDIGATLDGGYRTERGILAVALLRCRRGWGRFAAEAGGLSMHAAITDKREELAELCRQYDVARTRL